MVFVHTLDDANLGPELSQIVVSLVQYVEDEEEKEKNKDLMQDDNDENGHITNTTKEKEPESKRGNSDYLSNVCNILSYLLMTKRNALREYFKVILLNFHGY